MLVSVECVPCMLNMAINAMRQLTSDELLIETLLAKVLRIPALRGLNWDITCPEIAELVIRDIADLMDDEDPFKAIKALQNRKAMAIYPWLKSLIQAAPDSLYLAVNLAIYGNHIDVMMKHGESMDIKALVEEKLNFLVPRDDFSTLKKRIKGAKLIVYFGDNSGEIVFDKMLIEAVKKKWDPEIVYVVRSCPALNDVTMEEAKAVGMNETASLMENGIDGPFPGTLLRRCSNNLMDVVKDADLLISKGGANYESLEEETMGKDISYLFLTKCPPLCRNLHTSLDTPILKNRYGTDHSLLRSMRKEKGNGES